MDNISTIPTGQFVLLGIAGSLAIVTSLYLFYKGNFIPFAIVALVGFLIFITHKRLQKTISSRPLSEYDRAFDVFRSMEPADQTRVNVWMGFLQEDVFAKKTGPIGTFKGHDDYAKKAPLYPIYAGQYNETKTGVLTGPCPSKDCKCYPSPDVPGKTVCGYMNNNILIKCPSDCCPYPNGCDL